MNHKLIFPIFCILLLAGCSSEGRRLKTDTGYEYQIVRKGDPDKPIAVNSYVFFHMSLMSDDTLLQTTSTMGKPSVLKYMDDNTNYGQLEPLVEHMGTLHKGDSMLFYFPLDSLDNKTPMFDTMKG